MKLCNDGENLDTFSDTTESAIDRTVKLFKMVTLFSEIAFLSDRDILSLLVEIDNQSLQMALYDCDPMVKAKVFKQFNYIGWQNYEMDRKALDPPRDCDVKIAQEYIVSILNYMIENLALEDYLNISKAT